MCTIIQAKYKPARQFGIQLFRRLKRNIKKNRPGEHGVRFKQYRVRIKRNQDTSYSNLFAEKQRLRRYYGSMQERQFKHIFEQSKSVNEALSNLESRLDVVLLRMHLAPTIGFSRQLISHGYVLVNSNKITSPSYRLLPMECVAVQLRSKYYKTRIRRHFWTSLFRIGTPAYLEVNFKTMSGMLLSTPKPEQIPYPFIVERDLLESCYQR